MRKGRSTLLGRASVLMVVLYVGCCCAANASFLDTFDDGYQSWLQWDGVDTYMIDDNPGMLRLATAANSPDSQIYVTSKQKFTYGVYDIRFRATNDGWNYLYFGFCSREPWVNPSVMMRLDNVLMLAAGDGPGRANWDALNPNDPYLTPGA